MTKKCIVGLIFLFSCGYAYSQTSTCAQTLRLARSTYEQGRFHEIPGLLDNCLNGGSSTFTKQERIEALRILTLAYLYQEEPVEADAAMIKLLNTDHFFEINENVDPAEFTALYSTFRTKPVFSIGGKFGVNYTYPAAFKNFYVGNASANGGVYAPAFTIQGGLSFEKKLFESNPNSKWTAAPEIMYYSHVYNYENLSVTTSDQTGLSYSEIRGTFKQGRLDLNGLLQYKIKESSLNPYITFGPGISYLLSGSAQLETSFPSAGSVVTGPSVDLVDTFKPFDYMAIVGSGIKIKFGDVYATVDIRYKYGLTNLINESSRSNAEATFDYGFVSNDLRQSSVIINIGFTWPYFNPIKLLK